MLHLHLRGCIIRQVTPPTAAGPSTLVTGPAMTGTRRAPGSADRARAGCPLCTHGIIQGETSTDDREWIRDATGPGPPSACGVAGTAEAARPRPRRCWPAGRAQAARVEQAAIVVGSTLTYDYWPTGRGGAPGWKPASPHGRYTFSACPGRPRRDGGRVQVRAGRRDRPRAGRRRDAQARPARPQRGATGPATGFSPSPAARRCEPCQGRCPDARAPARVPAPASRSRAGPAPATRPASLSRALAALRHASGLTQPALSALTGYSITTSGTPRPAGSGSPASSGRKPTSRSPPAAS